MLKQFLHKLIFLFVIFITFSSFSYAEISCEQNCKIKDWPSPILLEYITDNRKIISNISKELWQINKKEKIPTWVSFKGFNTRMTGGVNRNIWYKIYNTLFNWREFESGFSLFLSQVNSSLSTQVNRDLMIISNQNKSLNIFITRLVSNWHSFTILNNICEWIENKWCEKLLNKNLWMVMTSLLRNNMKLYNLFQWEVGISIKNEDFNFNDLFLVWENFEEEFKIYYNSNTEFACSKCSWGALNRLNKAIDKITLNDKAGEKWIEEWKDAWSLLLQVVWNSKETKEYRELERELLEEELSKKWIGSKSILKWLENFNNRGLTLKNNPITNSYKTFIDSFKVNKIIKVKNDLTAIWNLLWEWATFVWNSLTLGEINVLNVEIKQNVQIKNKIDRLVRLNEIVIARQNQSSWQLQSRIIKMHINLVQAINQLDDIIPKAEKICNDQDKWSGKCSF